MNAQILLIFPAGILALCFLIAALSPFTEATTKEDVHELIIMLSLICAIGLAFLLPMLLGFVE